MSDVAPTAGQAEPSLRDQAVAGSSGAALATAGLACIVLFGFLLALEAQFERYVLPHPPPAVATTHSYDALHGEGATRAIEEWSLSAQALDEFDPIDPKALVQVHVGADAVFAAALLGFLVLLIRRLELDPRLLAVAAAGFLADILEGALELRVIQNPSSDLSLGFWILGMAKWVLPAIVIGCALWSLRGSLRGAWETYRASPATARLIMWAAIVFIGATNAGDIGAQAEDALRRELDLDLYQAALRVVGALGIYLLVLAVVRKIIVPPGRVPEPASLAAYGLAVLVAGAGVIWGLGMGSALVALGAILLLIAFSSWRVGERPAGEQDQTGRVLYVVSAVVPPTALALLAGRVLAAEVATDGRWLMLLVVQIVLLLVAVGVGWWFLSPLPPPETTMMRDPDGPRTAWAQERRWRASQLGWGRVAFLGGVASAALAFALVHLWFEGPSRWVGRGIGAVAVLLFGLAAFAAAGGLVRAFAADWDRPSVFAAMGMERTPVIGILLIWFLLVNAWTVRLEQPDQSPHLVRPTERIEATPVACDEKTLRALGSESGEADPNEVAQSLCSWIERNAVVDAGAGAGPVPMVLVTASGGGVRAAVWTARVLDCLLMPQADASTCGGARVVPGESDDPWANVFAAGGASGGSVGLVSAVGQRIAPLEGEEDWVHAVGGPDHVGPTLAHMVLAELAIAPTGLAPSHNRAEVLIDSWAETFGDVTECSASEASLADIGFLSSRTTCSEHVPLLLLNGTVVATGQRFDISPLVAPGDESVSLGDVLCEEQDLPLFDAAFLSARFPLVTPSGRFTSGQDAGCAGRPTPSGVDVVDGGYLENSGTAQVADLLDAMEPMLASFDANRPDGYRAIDPLVVRIVNGEVSTRPAESKHAGLASNYGEPFRVIEAKLQADRQPSDDPAVHHLCDAAARIDAPIVDFHLYPHPGSRLPLGWALTEHILADIDRVFRLGPNQQAAADVRALLDGAENDERPICESSP